MKPTYIYLILSLLSAPLWAQQQITVEDIYANGTFTPKTVRNVNWMNDGQFYTALESNNIVKYDISTGEQVGVLFRSTDHNLTQRISNYWFNPGETNILIAADRQAIYRRSYTAQYYLFGMETGELTNLSASGRQSYTTLSPDGSMAAFVRDNNLYYITLDSLKEVQVTADGEFNKIINGSTDWVYEEELYLTKAFFWSPDSKRLAFLKFDESEVRQYNLQYWDQGANYPRDYVYKYPKAGESNSKVSVHIYSLVDRKTAEVKVAVEDEDFYIPRINWTTNPNLLSIRKLNRLQNRLDIIHANVQSGRQQNVLTERSDTYIHLTYTDDLTYLKDGQHFIHTSDRNGGKHIYLHTMDGQVKYEVTTGPWEAVTLVGIDESRRRPRVYYMSTEDSPLERHLYAVDYDGKNKVKLSSLPGVHRADISRDFKYYMDYQNSAESVPVVNLYQVRGNKMIRTLEDNDELGKVAESYGLAKKLFYQFPTVDKTIINGYLLAPQDFDSTKVYPVLMFQYSGPGSQQVMNRWNSGNDLWHQMLVQKGYLVAVIDSRGTGGRGVEFKKLTYGQLGKFETEDNIEAAKHLGALDFVDASRIGIWGWSYGGFVSSSALFKGGDIFKMGIAVAPVSNWRYYDTIYTERYMGLPQQNQAGYDDNSPVFFAENLASDFLLVHGTGDDNVHFQNTVALQDALIATGKQFQSFYYPDRAHSIRKNKARVHLFQMLTDYVLRKL